MVCGGGGGWGKYFEEKDGCGTRGDWKAIWEYGGGWLWEMRRRDGLLGLRWFDVGGESDDGLVRSELEQLLWWFRADVCQR
uniref:Uncharacterized protein n=1 Tax=Knipowitschia caucasica TaxID=637954 RepID=A0AAV2KNY2_KNICA